MLGAAAVVAAVWAMADVDPTGHPPANRAPDSTAMAIAEAEDFSATVLRPAILKVEVRGADVLERMRAIPGFHRAALRKVRRGFEFTA